MLKLERGVVRREGGSSGGWERKKSVEGESEISAEGELRRNASAQFGSFTPFPTPQSLSPYHELALLERILIQDKKDARKRGISRRANPSSGPHACPNRSRGLLNQQGLFPDSAMSEQKRVLRFGNMRKCFAKKERRKRVSLGEGEHREV